MGFFLFRVVTKLVTCLPWKEETAGSSPSVSTTWCYCAKLERQLDCESNYIGSIPIYHPNAEVLELVDIAVLETVAERRESSSLSFCTNASLFQWIELSVSTR